MNEISSLPARTRAVKPVTRSAASRTRAASAGSTFATLRGLVLAPAELVHQERVGPSLLDSGQFLTRDVLDQAEQERVAVVGLADEGGHRGHAGLAGRPPPTLAGDQLEPAGCARAHHDRLDEPLRADRIR